MADEFGWIIAPTLSEIFRAQYGKLRGILVPKYWVASRAGAGGRREFAQGYRSAASKRAELLEPIGTTWRFCPTGPEESVQLKSFLNAKAHPAGSPGRMSFWFGQDPSVHIPRAEGEGEVRNFPVGKFGRFVGKEER